LSLTILKIEVPKNLLYVRDENGFEKLADFLGKNTNKKAFPHFNKSKLGMDLL